jgi:hypothetical protein
MSAIARGVIRAPSAISGATGISQDNIIFAMVLFAFVVYITTKNELPTYLAFFKPGATQGPLTAADNVTASSTTGTPTSVPAAITQTLGNVPTQVQNLIGGNVGGALYNAVIKQPLGLIQGLGHSLGIPGM